MSTKLGPMHGSHDNVSNIQKKYLFGFNKYNNLTFVFKIYFTNSFWVNF